MGDRPVWRQVFDQVERRLSPRASELTHTGRFADVTGFMLSAKAGLERRRRELLCRAWHAWNLPASSDVERLTHRVVELERRLRDLGAALEDDRPGPGTGPVAPKKAGGETSGRTGGRRRSAQPRQA
jgi:hypothetical protein